MPRPLFHTLLCAFPFLLIGCKDSHNASGGDEGQSDLREDLPRLGHRNFIVIADSAYPLQSAPGIRTVHVGGTQADALQKVLALLAKQNHVRPIAWLDSEQATVPEADPLILHE